MGLAKRGNKSTVIIPCGEEYGGAFPTLNDVIAQTKKHWSGYSTWKKSYTNRVASIAEQANKTHSCVCLRFTWYWKDRRTDPGNIASAEKYVTDGIVKGGLLKDDRWANVRRIEHDFDIDKEKPRIVVTLTEL